MLIPHQKLTIRSTDLLNGFFKQDFNNLSKYLPNRKYNWIGSAREGLRQILLDKKIKTVAIPSFSCKVILNSILDSNTKPIFIDSGVIPKIYDVKADALILPYNFGFIPDLDKIMKICNKNNIILIEDCAQALGARYKKKLVGEFGKYSVFSFGISKNIGFLGGLINKEFSLPSYSKIDLYKTSLESLISPIVFNPILFNYFNLILNSRLKGHSSLLRYKGSEFGKNIVLHIAKRYNEILKTRTENAKLLMEELDSIVDFVRPIKNTEPAWLYFIILDKERNKLQKDLLREKVDIRPLSTFVNMSDQDGIAQKTEDEHLAFALYRPKKEIQYIIKKIKKFKK